MDNTEINKQIKKEAAAVQRRVVGFLIYYFFLIFLGILLLAGVAWGTVKVLHIVAYLFYLSVRLGLIGSAIILCVWVYAISVGLFLIRPLFRSPKRDDSHRKEITEEEAPVLFAMIADIARQTGNKMPLHVFLTAEVNACVFYDKSTIWSIFFPPGKNLDIGIGLLHGMNVDEVRAILTHEFGHFSQQSMRVGTMSYRLLLVVNDMMKNTRDMLADDTGATTLRFITRNIINRYTAVEKRNRSLSRYMEFDADSVACQLVSSRALISALCKLSPISARYDLYSQMIAQALSEKQWIEHYFRGYLFAYDYYSADEQLSIENTDILTHPVGDEALYPSRLTILNGWNTHPSLQERIDNAHRFSSNKMIAYTAADTLVPEALLDSVGKQQVQRIALHMYAGSGNNVSFSPLTADTFETWARQSLSEHRLPLFLLRFAAETPDKDTIVNDENLPTEAVPSPFTIENRNILIEFQHARQDGETLGKIAAGEYDVEEMLYNNEYYTSATQPIEIHKEYMSHLTSAAQQVMRQVYIYMLQCREDESDKQSFKCTCAILWQTTEVLTNLSDIYQNAHGMLEGLKHFRSKGRNVQINDDALSEVSTDARRFLRTLDFPLLSALCGQWQVASDKTFDDFLTVWRDYAENATPLQRGILNTVEDMWQVFTYLHNVANDRWLHALAAAYSSPQITEK